MKNLTEKIQNRLENQNGLDHLLSEIAGVDYYSEEYNDIALDGFNFDLMYNVDEDCFEKCNSGEGELFEQTYNTILIANVECSTEEELVQVVEIFIEQKKLENDAE